MFHAKSQQETMKKRKSAPSTTTTTSTTTASAVKRRELNTKVVVVAEVEDRSRAPGCRRQPGAVEEEAMLSMATIGQRNVEGEEQMWWGGEWLPWWDVEAMGEAYISALYSDVWEGYDDIWGFRDSTSVSTTCPPS